MAEDKKGEVEEGNLGKLPKIGEESPKMRKIVIETDGNNINLVSADVAGRIELVGVLQSLITHLNQKK